MSFNKKENKYCYNMKINSINCHAQANKTCYEKNATQINETNLADQDCHDNKQKLNETKRIISVTIIPIPEANNRHKSTLYRAACNADNFDEKLVEKLPVMLMNVVCVGCGSLNFAPEVDKNGYSKICCRRSWTMPSWI